MKIALVAASECAGEILRASHYDYYLALDGGYASCVKYGITPQSIWGDFDSLGYVPVVSGVEVKKFPVDKDKSDLALGFDEVGRLCDAASGEKAPNNPHTIHVFGALGGRIDHSVASLNVAAEFACAQHTPVWLIGKDSSVCVLPGGAQLNLTHVDAEALKTKGPQAHFISLQAWGGPAEGVTCTGLKYPLSSAKLDALTSLGLSNEFKDRQAHISVSTGILLVTLNTDLLMTEGIVPCGQTHL